MKKQIAVSVVINTCDRAKYLVDTLEGLKQQTYDNFEVIVVNGPSQDNTEEIAKRYNVRYYTAPFNLSVSRNIGVKAASGEIVAFIDDDAVPTATWLEEIVAQYDDPKVGGAGGFVYQTHAAKYQFCYGAIDIWGDTDVKTEPGEPFAYNQPHANWYNVNIGTNVSFRREYLIEVGGFDEEIEYYHDESDVCVRMIDAGYKIVQISGATVHHVMAPSTRRTTWHTIVNWNSISKNSIYFALRHSKGKASFFKRLIKPGKVQLLRYRQIGTALARKQITFWQYLYKIVSLFGAMCRGYWRGYFSTPKLLQGDSFQPELFKVYKEGRMKNPYTIVLLSQGYPPEKTDGIARYNHTLARQLAKMGHRVHVVTRSPENREQVKYREGCWIHYHNPVAFTTPVTGYDRTDIILGFCKSVYKTVKDIAKERKIDVILSPLWDVEGLALQRHKIAPVIVTLMTPLKKIVETQWFSVNDPSFEDVYDLERYSIEHADGVMSISGAIKDTLTHDYGIAWDKLGIPVAVLPLGVDSSFAKEPVTNKRHDTVQVLFVGRFEKRKGIDLLLDVMPDLLKKYDGLELRLVGNSDIYDPSGRNFWGEFVKKYGKKSWFKRVRKDGYVSDEELAQAYAGCDIFVAPSRYESFGLIFIEAMANGKPVIGTKVGGIPETIVDGKNGYLFENENTVELSAKIEKLIIDRKLRRTMGEQGRQDIATKFNAEKMANGFLDMVKQVIKK